MSQSKRKKRKLFWQQENKDLSTVIVGICFIQEKSKAFFQQGLFENLFIF
jgi:hypothetical protein